MSNIMIGAVKKATVTEIVRSNINRYSLKDDPYDVASDIGKKYNWSVKKIEQAERVIRKSYINGIGAVKSTKWLVMSGNKWYTGTNFSSDLRDAMVYSDSKNATYAAERARGVVYNMSGSKYSKLTK